MLEGLRRSLGMDAPPKALADTLRSLQACEQPADLHARALAYVVRGEGAELLLELQPSDDVVPLHALGVLQNLRPWNNDLDDRIDAALPGWSVQKSAAAWRALITGPEQVDPELWARLLRLVAALVPAGRQAELGSPAWLGVLVRLWTWYDPFSYGNRKRVATWSTSLVEQVVVSAGVTPEAAPQVVLGAVLNLDTSRHSNPLLQPAEMAGVPDYLRRHADAVRAVVPDLTLAARQGFVQVLAADPPLVAQFAPEVAAVVGGSSKEVRTAALGLLEDAPVELAASVLGEALVSVPLTAVASVVEPLLALGPEGRAMIEAAIESSTTSRRAAVLRGALDRAAIIDDAPVADAAIPTPPWEAVPDVRLDEDATVTLLAAALAQQRAQHQKHLADLVDDEADAAAARWARDSRRRLTADLRKIDDVTPAQLRGLVRYLDGRGPQPDRAVVEVFEGQQFWMQGDKFPLRAAMRWATVREGRGHHLWWRVEHLSTTLPRETDLRALADAWASVGVDPELPIAELAFGWSGGDLDPANVWPWFAEHPAALEAALGVRPTLDQLGYEPVARALQILGSFPRLPAPLVPALAALATGTGKTHRRAAQRLLEQHAAAVPLAVHSLSAGNGDVRAAAATWLGQIGDPAGIEPLRALVAKEKRENVRATALSAVALLGEDVSTFLTPEVLATEAATGLRAKAPAGLDWFPFDGLPACRWAADGSAVPSDVLRWWVHLAVRLKDPLGAGLVPRYVSLLTPETRRALGAFVLGSWIAQDTAQVPDAQARDRAAAEAPAALAQHHSWAAQWPEHYGQFASFTLEEMTEQLRRVHAAEYLGSAIASKGVLSLAAGMDGHRAVAAVQAYAKDHGRRRSQLESLVVLLSAIDEPATVQYLLSVSRRFKQASIQERARVLVEEIAERKGWSADQLADRTIPTAGFDDTGVLVLDYGPRAFTARMTPTFALELSGPDGAVVKGLPPARSDDDAELVAAAKAQLTAARSGLKQVVTLQTQRLYEAMCVGRTWPADEWTEFLLGHPVVSRLVGTLVWVENPGPDARLFRPTPDGALVDAEDDDVELAPDAVVALAHAATMSADEVTAWRAHLADYAVVPRFDQLSSSVAEHPEGATSIQDRRGWLTDTFTVRGRATKRGYQRGPAEDGGWFSTYTKSFTSAGLEVVIEFTGSTLPEENVAAAVRDLSFRATSRRRSDIPLTEVPPVLLAEAYSDYLHVAAGGSFDADWEKKCQW